MTSPSHYYEESLYPLQDGVLNVLAHCNVPFFLTGGTALSRAYYSHRYSDDLDFFTDNDPNYQEEVQLIFARLKENGYSWPVEGEDYVKAINFYSIKVHRADSDTILKLDFVNDLVPHFGEIRSTNLYYRVDPIRNILSNKIGAVFRFAGKDVADIREIARHERFNWHDVIKEAQCKDGGVNEPLITEILGGMPKTEFHNVLWQDPAPTWEAFRADIAVIIRDMLTCVDNTLC
jgi:predicted nucleotidyltransferase component of viral defense system